MDIAVLDWLPHPSLFLHWFQSSYCITYSLISRVTNQTWPKTGVNDDYHHHELVDYKFKCESHLQVWLEKRYVGSRHTSEWFNTAGRNVKTGLIASVIVSQVMCSGRRPSLLEIWNFPICSTDKCLQNFDLLKWTWAATILQSSNVAWQYGVSGPFWYASGATIQACFLSYYLLTSLSPQEGMRYISTDNFGHSNEQVLLFGVMAIEIKRKAPYAHTVCEIVKARYVN